MTLFMEVLQMCRDDFGDEDSELSPGEEEEHELGEDTGDIIDQLDDLYGQ